MWVLSDLRAAGPTKRGDLASADGVLSDLHLLDQGLPAGDEQPALCGQRDRQSGPGRDAKVVAQLVEGRAELGRGGETPEPPHRVVALLDGPVASLGEVVLSDLRAQVD